jgi:insecticidal toxin complex protein TccC
MPTPNPFHAGTPDITVLSPQGLPIRQLRYCRSQADGEAAERIEQQRYTPLGHPAAHIDARFFAAGGATCNFRYHTALAGLALHTQSIDAGDSWVLLNAEGQPHWQRDARGTEQRFAYDALGRLLSRSETLADAPPAIRERLCYGDDAVDAAQRNLRGQRLQHYDTAGALDYGAGYSLTGQPLQETRQLLPVDMASHWEGDDEAQWQAELEPTPYMTRWQYGLNGQLLLQTDAQEHRQRMAYDVAGRLKASWVQLKDQAEQPVLLHISYSAAGQKLCETAGNGVVTAYTYEAATQRLVGVTTTRPVQGDRKTLLQKLRYEYDPVGNITALYSDADAARYYKNQRILPEKHYIYDSLYQLIQATGSENASLDSHHDDPSATPPLDSLNLVNYTRRYDYDAGGNLCQIQHNGAQSFTRQLTVSSHSNHALLHTEGLTPDTVRQRFDACGNQRQLDNGAALGWNGLNQLSHVITVDRDAQPDGERYQYAAAQRVRKTALTQAGGAAHRQEVIYLPGLELRCTTSGEIEQEKLQVLSIGAAGRSQVRLLHWQAGQPADIANAQLRYSLDDHLGSCLLELDSHADIVTFEDYYPYGGTAVRSARNQSEVRYKTVRYSGKERDATGLYYYGYRYYQPWLGRWLNPDPAGTVDGLNLFCMVRNNPTSLIDNDGCVSAKLTDSDFQYALPKPAINYTRGKEYRLTRSVSVPNIRAAVQKTNDKKKFIGYHGTNELSAKNILEKGLDIDRIPHGQIGQGFYIAKDRYLADGSSNPSGSSKKSEIDKNIPFYRKIQNITLDLFGSKFAQYKFKPDYPDDITPVFLKVYQSQQVVHSQWNSMLSNDLAIIQYSKPEERQSVANDTIKNMGKNLQMLIPSEEFNKLSISRDDGRNETGSWYPARESHVPQLHRTDI